MGNLVAKEILKLHEIRASNQRVALLEILMSSHKAFTLSEIEKELTVAIDRVTVYRTLQSYEVSGLVVKMVNRKGICMYMYNHERHNGSFVHPHLHCKSCEKVICLPSLPKEYMDNISKHKVTEIYFLMEGVCSECRSSL